MKMTVIDDIDEFFRYIDELEQDVSVRGARVYDADGRLLLSYGGAMRNDRTYEMVRERLLGVAAAASGCTREELLSASREERMVQGRFLVMYYLNVRYGYGPTMSGRAVDRNHSTVAHAVRVVREAMADPRRARRMFEMLCRFEELLSATDVDN